MTTTVTFKFSIDDEVLITRTGEHGTVTMCAIDDGGPRYFIQTANSQTWWPERLLKKADDRSEKSKQTCRYDVCEMCANNTDDLRDTQCPLCVVHRLSFSDGFKIDVPTHFVFNVPFNI